MNENGHKPSLGFEDIFKILLDENKLNQRPLIMWEFLGLNYFSSNFSVVSSEFGGKIIAHYTNNKNGEGTFILDKNTRANHMSCIFLPKRK